MNRFYKYSLLFLLIAQSSIPFFFGNEYLIAGFIYSFILFLSINRSIDKYIILYSAIFVSLFILHFFFADDFVSSLMVGYIIRIFFAYFTIRVIGEEFGKYVVNIIYFFAVVSFFFYIPLSLFPGLQNITTSLYYNVFKGLEVYPDNFRINIILYTPDYWLNWIPPRNAGPFWEPGGFATFLVVAIILNFYETKKMFDKKNIIFILALLTTFSTAAYILLSLILILFYLSKRNFRSITIALPFIIFLSYFGYYQLPFLQEKIESQYTEFSLYSNPYSERTRLASTYYDIQSIMKNPIIGKGRVERDEFERDVNGFTALVKQFGLIGFFTYFGFIFISLKKKATVQNLSNEWIFYSVIILAVNGLSQSIFGKPFFISLAFIYATLPFVKNKINYKYNDY